MPVVQQLLGQVEEVQPEVNQGTHPAPAVEQDVGIGKFAPCFRREAEQRPGAALNVDPAVLAGRAGEIVELVQFLLARHDREAQPLDQPRPLM